MTDSGEKSVEEIAREVHRQIMHDDGKKRWEYIATALKVERDGALNSSFVKTMKNTYERTIAEQKDEIEELEKVEATFERLYKKVTDNLSASREREKQKDLRILQQVREINSLEERLP